MLTDTLETRVGYEKAAPLNSTPEPGRATLEQGVRGSEKTERAPTPRIREEASKGGFASEPGFRTAGAGPRGLGEGCTEMRIPESARSAGGPKSPKNSSPEHLNAAVSGNFPREFRVCVDLQKDHRLMRDADRNPRES